MKRATDLLAEEIIWARTRLGEVILATDVKKLCKLPLPVLLKESQIVQQALCLRIYRENFDALQYFRDTFLCSDDEEDERY